MPKEKSYRNKTIDFSLDEGIEYFNKCLSINDLKQDNSLSSLINKTICGDTFEVRKVIAPYKSDGVPKDWSETQNGKFRDTCPSNFWDDCSVPYWSMPENTAHPTQKPEKLLAKMILASSNKGDIVFDPFLGSGSTSVNDIENCPRNFEILFPIHSELGFEGNLDRLVEATNNISPSGQKASITAEAEKTIMDAPRRAKAFVDSNEYSILKKELDDKTEKYQSEIVLANKIA